MTLYHANMTGADLHNPKAHAASHATAGSDAITPASIGAAAASGLALLDAEVSAHVATSGTDAHLIGNISGLEDTLNDKISSTLTKEPTGFDVPENVVVSYDGTERKITLTGTGWKAYWRGAEVTALTNGWISSAHGSGNGTYFLYYNGTDFVWSTTPWDFSDLMIAMVYKNTVAFGVRDCHGLMAWQAHKQMHESAGSYLRSGGDMSGYVLSSTTAADRRPDISSAIMVDEDTASTLPALTTEVYSRFTLSSANTANISVDQAEILPVTGSVPYYNQYTGGNWVQTAFPVNAYGKVFVVAIPATADSESQKYRFLFIQPQIVSTNLSTIQAVSSSSVNWGSIAGSIPEFVFIGEIIVRYQSGNWTIISAAKLNGTRISQSSTATGLTAVSTDSSLTGNGTPASPLSAATALSAKAAINRIPEPDTNGLLRYFKFDGDANDYSGNDKHLSVASGTPVYRYDQLLGRRVVVLQGGPYFSGDDTGLPTGTSPCTIMAWIWMATNGKAAIGYGTTAANKQLVALGGGSSSGTVQASFQGFQNGSSYYMANFRWCHAAHVYNGTTAILYVDGIAQSSQSIALEVALYGSAGLKVGNTPVTLTNQWGGALGPITIYNRALSAAEVLSAAQFGGN